VTTNSAACSCSQSAPQPRTVTGQAGAATAANDTIREAGGALGVAIVGSLARAQTQPNPIAAPAGLQ
jgi:hypothetical protein